MQLCKYSKYHRPANYSVHNERLLCYRNMAWKTRFSVARLLRCNEQAKQVILACDLVSKLRVLRLVAKPKCAKQFLQTLHYAAFIYFASKKLSDNQ